MMTHKTYLALALPFVLSTVTQPLLGAVDTAVVGRLSNASYIGGVAIGTVIFNTLYWVFGFLRVSTSGFAAQAMGTGLAREKSLAWLRPLIIALAMGTLFVLCQSLILDGAIYLYHPEADVASHARTYFRILIWGAPLVLVTYVNLGWLMGQKRVRETLFLQVSTNVMNIVLDLAFVCIFKMGVAGVAWATLISQGYGFLLGAGLVAGRLGREGIFGHVQGVLAASAMKKILGVNRDLVIRTLCLLTMTNLFVAKGSELGQNVLAANAILFQVQYIVAYFFDGLANASSVFAGDCLGRKDFAGFRRTRQITDCYLAGLSLVAAVILLVFQGPIIRCFTRLPEVVSLCHTYMGWLVFFPFAVGPGLVYFGFYTGATYTAPVRNSMLMALAVFTAAYYTLVPLYGNHGLWLAFVLFSLCRSMMLFMGMKGMEQRLFAGNGQAAVGVAG